MSLDPIWGQAPNHPEGYCSATLSAFPSGPVLPQSEDLCDVRVVRTRPRVSIHRLAQYMEATPARRRQIISAEKYPSPFRVSYWPAKRLFREALRLGWDEETLFEIASERWFSADAETDLADFRRRQAMDAIAEFCGLLEPVKEQLSCLSASVRLSGRVWAPFELGGVQVVDSPELVLRRFRRGDDEVGVMTFSVSKTKPHNEGSAKRAAALLVALAAENKTTLTSLTPELCIVVDVFSGLIVDADRGNEHRLRKAELACEEISAMWNHI